MTLTTWVRGHARSPDLSPIDRPYISFYRHSSNFGYRLLRFRYIAGFVSKMPLLYIYAYPSSFAQKLETFDPRVRSMSSIL